MNQILKNTMKFAVGTCVTLGSIALAVPVVVGSPVAKVVGAGFKAAKEAMKEEITALKEQGEVKIPVTKAAAEEAAMFADVEEAQENN